MSEWIIATFTFLRYVRLDNLDIEICTNYFFESCMEYVPAGNGFNFLHTTESGFFPDWFEVVEISVKHETLSILSSSHCAWTPRAIFWTCHWCCAHLMKRGEAESEIFLSTSPSFFPFPSGSFTNCVDKIWPIIDHLPNPCCHLWRIRFEK